MKSKTEFKFICTACGKEFTGRTDKNDINYKAPTSKEKCKCGGKFRLEEFSDGVCVWYEGKNENTENTKTIKED